MNEGLLMQKDGGRAPEKVYCVFDTLTGKEVVCYKNVDKAFDYIDEKTNRKDSRLLTVRRIFVQE